MEATPAVASNSSCKFCGSKSALLHDALTDRLVGTAGSWRMLRCTNKACGLAYQFGYAAPTIKGWEILGGRLLACLPIAEHVCALLGGVPSENP
jgi:hypothetical protein